nr:MAG TPA: hypothetical protein [Caudoviricetes sp.]DAU89241.1 MAG TPA: hypothetical protein [Caudoviricetes sp.]
MLAPITPPIKLAPIPIAVPIIIAIFLRAKKRIYRHIIVVLLQQ